MDPGDAFEEFVRTQSPGLLRTAWLLTGEWHSAEDLVQSALAVTWQQWPKITRRDAPALYTRRVMTTSYLRSRRRRWIHELPWADPPDATALTDEYARSDERQVLLKALDGLKGRQRAVVALRFFADLSVEQTAEALGCSVGAVKTHTAKAMTRLRRTTLLGASDHEEASK